MTEPTETSVELRLRDELVRGDAAVAGAGPVLRHLLAHDDHALFGDETIARVRGMIAHLASQLLFAQGEAAGAGDLAGYVGARGDELAQALSEDAALLGHAHALTIEAQLGERLQGRNGIDSVLPPLVQQLAAAENADTAALAMAVLAAQARFMQHHRRTELPLGELPGDRLHQVLVAHREWAGVDEAAAEGAEKRLRAAFDEAASRLSLLTRLVMGLGPEASEALAIDHAGVAIFATSLATASNQDRDSVVLSLAEPRGTRLALALRAAGLAQSALERQLLHIQVGIALPDGFSTLTADRAATLLAGTD